MRGDLPRIELALHPDDPDPIATRKPAPPCRRHGFSEFTSVRERQRQGLIIYYNHNIKMRENNWKQLVIF